MKKDMLSLLTVVLLLLNSCSSIKINEDAHIRMQKHERIAIAPTKVTTPNNTFFRPGLYKGQKMASFQMHNAIHDWIIENTDTTNYWFEIIDSSQTLSQLKDSGYYDENVFTPSEIAGILEVDALIMTTFILDRKLSITGRDVERFGDYAPTQNSNALVEIFDSRSRKILWSYYHRFSPGLERSDEAFVHDLFEDIIDKMPYFQEHKSPLK